MDCVSESSVTMTSGQHSARSSSFDTTCPACVARQRKTANARDRRSIRVPSGQRTSSRRKSTIAFGRTRRSTTRSSATTPFTTYSSHGRMPMCFGPSPDPSRRSRLALGRIALVELGKALRTTFLCRYLHRMEPRREIHEGLNVVGGVSPPTGLRTRRQPCWLYTYCRTVWSTSIP